MKPILQSYINQSKKLNSDNTLHVIRVISNPARYHSRYRLAFQQSDFLKRCPNIKLYTVECAFGDRSWEILPENIEFEKTLRVRTRSEIWNKENMINLGIRHLLPPDWKYVAWIDADICWNDKNWGSEVLQELQHYQVLQPWAQCIDEGQDGSVLSVWDSFGAQAYKQFEIDFNLKARNIKPKIVKGIPTTSIKDPYSYLRYGHTGYAWACTRLFYENIRGLMDFCILGSADHNMALAMINRVDDSIHKDMTQSFKNECHRWQDQAVRITNKQIGYTKHRIHHWYHGKKADRQYLERWAILTHYKFDPLKDLKRNSHGLIELSGKPELEQAIRHYNRSRNEDSI